MDARKDAFGVSGPERKSHARRFRTLKRNIGPDLPSDDLSQKMLLKAEDIKRAEAYFLEYCKLNCDTFTKAPDETLRKIPNFASPEEEKKFTELARAEFRRPDTAIENRIADPKVTANDHHDARVLRSLPDAQNQTASTPGLNSTLPPATATPPPNTTRPEVTTTAAPAPTTPIAATTGPTSTSPTSTTTNPQADKAKEGKKPGANDIDKIIDDWGKTISDVAELVDRTIVIVDDFIKCTVNAIMKDLGVEDLKKECENSSVPRFFSTVSKAFLEDFSGEEEDVRFRMDVGEGTRAEGETPTAVDSVDALTDYLQRRLFKPKTQSEDQ